MNNQTKLIMNMTGDIFQPIRLYYRIHNMEMMSRIFRAMSCMNFDHDNNRWIWLYDGEAKSLKFKTPYSSIPKERRPIILGSFYSDGNNEMRLDIGSIERATTAVVFFDKRISRAVAEIAYFAIYNKLLPQTELPGSNFDKLFAGVKTEEIEAKQAAEIERVATMVKSGRLLDMLQERHFELVESFPVNFYSDGIGSFEGWLQMRQAVALKRWQGNKDFTITDLLRSLQ